MLQRARIKIVARAIYTSRYFSYTYFLVLSWNIKNVLIAVYLSKLDCRLLFNDICYVDWFQYDYSKASNRRGCGIVGVDGNISKTNNQGMRGVGKNWESY